MIDTINYLYAVKIEDCDKVINDNPFSDIAYFNRGVIKYHYSLYLDAINDYDMAIILNDNFAGSYYYRGLAKYNLGKSIDALNDLQKAIELYYKQCDMKRVQEIMDFLNNNYD